MWDFFSNNTLDVVVNGLLVIQLLTIFWGSFGDEFWKKRSCYRYFLLWVGVYILYLGLDILQCLSVGLHWSDTVSEIFTVFYESTGCVIYFAPLLWAVELAKEKQYVSPKLVGTMLGIIFVADLVILGLLLVDVAGADMDNSRVEMFIQISLSHYSVLIDAIFFLVVILLHKSLGTKASLYMIAFVAVPTALELIDGWPRLPAAIGTVGITYFIYMDILQRRKIEYAAQQTELSNTRMALMRSQIQPHFLYNSLSAIVALCDIDPKKARQTTLDFSTYLERNLDSLVESHPVPFLKELSHVEAYLRIEQTRFGEMLQVDYQVRINNFKIPSLTVQPLVENAVKHGICHKQGGGTITISTTESNEAWFVIVKDDGVGFDVNNPEIQGHGVGLSGIRQRLAVQCEGTLTVESTPGEGTMAVITIPKGV